MPKIVHNPYIVGTFKHHFIEQFNKLSKAKKDQDVHLPMLLAESFAIFLELINDDQEKDEKATIIIEGETNAVATRS